MSEQELDDMGYTWVVKYGDNICRIWTQGSNYCFWSGGFGQKGFKRTSVTYYKNSTPTSYYIYRSPNPIPAGNSLTYTTNP